MLNLLQKASDMQISQKLTIGQVASYLLVQTHVL